MKPLISRTLFCMSVWALTALTHAAETDDYQAALENYRQGQYGQAAIGFQKVIQEDPHSWQAYQGLGCSLFQEGNKAVALQAYQTSLQLNPNNPTVKSMVDMLSAAAAPAAQATASSPGKLEPIGTFSDNHGKKLTSRYVYEGEPLEGDPQIKAIVSRLNDPPTNQLIDSAMVQQTAGTVLDVVGGLSVLGGIIYAVAAKGAPVTNGYFPGGGAIVSNNPPDLTPSWIMGGAGAGMVLAAFFLEDGAGQNRYQAVTRYDQMIGAGPGPGEPNNPVAGEIVEAAPATAAPGQGASPSAPVAAASTPETGAAEGEVGLGFQVLADFPLSNKTASEYVPGFGYGLDFKLPLDRNWSVGLGVSTQAMPVNTSYINKTFQQTYGVPLPSGVSFSGAWNYIPVAALVQYSIPVENSKVAPYMFVGGGLAFNSAGVTATINTQTVDASVNETDFLLCPGMGLKVQVSPKADLFLQGRLDILFTSQNNSDVITETTNGSSTQVKGNLSDDSPTFFLPVYAGVRF